MDHTISDSMGIVSLLAAGLLPGTSFLAIVPSRQFDDGIEELRDALPYGSEVNVIDRSDNIVALKITRWNVLFRVLPNGGIFIDYTV